MTIRHGGSLDQWMHDFPGAVQPWLDLSTGVSPWAYPLDVQQLAEVITRLPSAHMTQQCREAMALSFDCCASRILPVAGTELMIRLLPRVLKLPLLLSPPVYGDYEEAWRLAGLPVTEAPDPLQLERSDLANRCVVVCNPNNPDGRSWTPDSLLELHDKVLEVGGWLLVDEAYCEQSPACSLITAESRPKLLVLRSFGKFFGLPGLRLGAVIGEPSLLKELQQWLGHWQVSTVALAAGVQAYRDLSWQDQHRERIGFASQNLLGQLQSSGIPVVGSAHLFTTIATPGAHQLWQQLMEAGIYTRHFQSYPELIRMGLPATVQDQERLLLALRLNFHGDARDQ